MTNKNMKGLSRLQRDVMALLAAKKGALTVKEMEAVLGMTGNTDTNIASIHRSMKSLTNRQLVRVFKEANLAGKDGRNHGHINKYELATDGS